MREERGTILFRDLTKKCGFVVPSSGGGECDNVLIDSAELARSAVHFTKSWRLHRFRPQASAWAFC